ncbi:ABC transporter permease [Agrobacterium vitis]|uniref:ABC transporter permease n=1 Tax=Agrobacterium vitis TaxID=373 RepID=UPI001F239028|nr:ABC transporter permease [Agrobacterium vitis]
MTEQAVSTTLGDFVPTRRPFALLAALVVRVGPLMTLIAGWEAACDFGAVRPVLLPAPSVIARTIWDMALSGELAEHVAVSCGRVLQGFAIAAVLALTLGILMGLVGPLNRLADLIVQVLKPIPPIAWIPLSILWFGIGEEAKIFIIFLGAFFPILVSTLDAVRQTDVRYVELARALEVPRLNFIRRVMIPGALPQIMSGLRLGITMSWMCVVAAELIAASSGIGFLIMDGRVMSNASVVLAGMITLGVLGKLTDDALRFAERHLVRWRAGFNGL